VTESDKHTPTYYNMELELPNVLYNGKKKNLGSLFPWTNVMKPFTNVHNKLECLSLAGLFRPRLMFVVRPGAYPRVENMKDASLG
jgi:hypothetical protein